jgi:phage tail-like protein
VTASVAKANSPTELTAEEADGVVTLSWTNNGGTGKILIERRVNKEGWQRLGSVESDTDTFEDETIEADGTYFYRVKSANEKVYSNEAGISVKAHRKETEKEKDIPAPTVTKEQNPTPNPNQDWKQPKFRFEVEIPELNSTIMVQEIAGLNTEEQPIEYRQGNSKVFSTQKMPGLKKNSELILKKGIFANDKNLWDWYKQIKSNNVQRRTVIIRLLDEDGNPTMVWTLTNAFPAKITGTDLKADIIIDFETITIQNK